MTKVLFPEAGRQGALRQTELFCPGLKRMRGPFAVEISPSFGLKREFFQFKPTFFG